MMYVGLYYTYLYNIIYIGCWYIKCIIIKKNTIPHTKYIAIYTSIYIYCIIISPKKNPFFQNLLLKKPIRHNTKHRYRNFILPNNKKKQNMLYTMSLCLYLTLPQHLLAHSLMLSQTHTLFHLIPIFNHINCSLL